MDGWTVPIGLFIFVGIVAFLALYVLARQRSRDYRNSKRKFSALSGNLLQLKEHVTAESDRWPIYTRPVMFTAIDHDAQIEFAKAQKALTDADQMLPEIEMIEEPETPEQFRVDFLFNVPKNLKTISVGNQLIGTVSSFERKIADIKSSIRSLRTDRHQVENRRFEVEKSIEDLEYRIEQTNTILKPINVWKLIEAHNFSWIVSIAERCYLEAKTRVHKMSEDEQGYLEHAIADAFVEVGNFSLDCIDLFMESQAISGRYKLDVFTQLFDESIAFFHSIVNMEEDWNGWRRLKRARAHIDRFPETRQWAERSLHAFKHQQHNLERLITLINEINLAAEIEKVDVLEKNCTYYWYSYEERTTFWEKALGTPPRFPSAELNRFQTLLVGDIYPRIEVDMFIEQSRALGLIRLISQALEWHTFIKQITVALETELNYHKEAQKEVNALLDSQGKATVILAEVKLALIDTSPDLGDLGASLVKDHQGYVGRAQRVRGADFPDLRESLEQLIVDSGTMVDQHSLQLARLMAEYKDLGKKVEALLNEIDLYINHVPRFDNQTIKIFSINYKKGWNMLQERAMEKYSWLREITNKMRTWLQNAEPFTGQARDKYLAFLAGKKQVQTHLQKSTEEIQTQRIFTQKRWGWLRNEITPLINQAEQSLNLEISEWRRLEERNWAELTVHKAISRCENFVKSTEEILDELNQKIGRINQRQKMLSNKASDIEHLLQNNFYKLPPQDRQEIRSLNDFAMRAENYVMADKILDYARTLAVKRASSQDRSEIKKIINVYSEGGPVFTGPVDNRRGRINGRVTRRRTRN